MKRRLLLLAVILAITTNVFADPDPNFYIFLCFGQSNMERFPGIEDVDKTGVDKRFQVLASTDVPKLGRIKGNWYDAVPPLCRSNSGLCPADFFGRTLVAGLPENIRVGVVNVSVAGCKIELFEKDNYTEYASTAPSWMANIIEGYGGNPYQYLVDTGKLAQEDGVIKGILLHQGESNTNDTEWPGKVKGIYDNLIKDLNLNAEKIPLLAGEVVNADQGGACASMNEIIATLPQTIPNSYVISSAGCTCRRDNLHFDAAGYRELGTRYAGKMLPLLSVSQALIPTQTQGDASSSTETASRTVEDGGTGPYSALMVTDGTLATHTIFRPKDLSVFGKNNTLPIIVWGNGACANSPWEHVNFLSEVSSHGFLVIAIGPMPQEGERSRDKSASMQLIDAIDWAIAQNSDRTSRYYNKIDITKIAVSGMSCGGLQALECAPDPRVTTAVICNSGILPDPGSGMAGMPGLAKDHLEKLHSPALYILGGESDIAYNNGMDDYRRLNHVPVFAANMDVGHGGTYGQPHGGAFAKVATAWFKWQLKGDTEASGMFAGDPSGLSQSPGWTVEKKNIP
ncbi:sialate O-acetylesterase [Candidatus Latescibacterota bacterium]